MRIISLKGIFTANIIESDLTDLTTEWDVATPYSVGEVVLVPSDGGNPNAPDYDSIYSCIEVTTGDYPPSSTTKWEFLYLSNKFRFRDNKTATFSSRFENINLTLQPNYDTEDVNSIGFLGLNAETVKVTTFTLGTTNKITNGTFPTDISGWADGSVGTGQVIWDSANKVKITRDANSSNIGVLSQSISGTSGKRRRVYCYSHSDSTAHMRVQINGVYESVNVTPGESKYYDFISDGNDKILFICASNNSHCFLGYVYLYDYDNVIDETINTSGKDAFVLYGLEMNNAQGSTIEITIDNDTEYADVAQIFYGNAVYIGSTEYNGTSLKNKSYSIKKVDADTGIVSLERNRSAKVINYGVLIETDRANTIKKLFNEIDGLETVVVGSNIETAGNFSREELLLFGFARDSRVNYADYKNSYLVFEAEELS